MNGFVACKDLLEEIPRCITKPIKEHYMKKGFLIFAALLFSMAFIQGCKKGSDGTNGKYGIKAGSFTYVMNLGFGPVETVTYFDDYGAKECSETKTEMKLFGVKISQHNRTLTKDGYSYNLDLTKKTGTKMKLEGLGEDMKMSFAAMSAAMKDSITVKELGEEDVIGKKCRKIEVTMKDGGSMGTFWLWKNITLKMENKDKKTGAAFAFTATKVEELSSVPNDLFEIPSDIKITETTMPAE